MVRSPGTSQTQLVCLQTLLRKYNQQYHKLFKDIPLEEVVLKGELSPRVAGQAPAVPKAQVLSPRASRHKSDMGTGCPLNVPFFSSKV